jgi:intein-encoded DNA endonuclease-like protein
MIVLSTCTPIKHHNNTPFMENLNPKCDKNKYKKYQILKLFQNENEIKNKIFTCKLYPFNIDVYFRHQNTSCTLLKIVYIIQAWKTWIFLNNIINHNFIFIYMVKEKTMELWFQFLNMYN